MVRVREALLYSTRILVCTRKYQQCKSARNALCSLRHQLQNWMGRCSIHRLSIQRARPLRARPRSNHLLYTALRCIPLFSRALAPTSTTRSKKCVCTHGRSGTGKLYTHSTDERHTSSALDNPVRIGSSASAIAIACRAQNVCIHSREQLHASGIVS